jgi:hypothetical protein
MDLCVIIVLSLIALLIFMIYIPRTFTVDKDGFADYVVFTPGPYWRGWGRRPWWHRRFRAFAGGPGRADYFF